MSSSAHPERRAVMTAMLFPLAESRLRLHNDTQFSCCDLCGLRRARRSSRSTLIEHGGVRVAVAVACCPRGSNLELRAKKLAPFATSSRRGVSVSWPRFKPVLVLVLSLILVHATARLHLNMNELWQPVLRRGRPRLVFHARHRLSARSRERREGGPRPAAPRITPQAALSPSVSRACNLVTCCD